LGGDEQKRLLLIDELNRIDNLSEKNDDRAETFAKFLKDNFLVQTGHYFVFSSHILTTEAHLASYLDWKSDRGLILKELSVIPSIRIAKQIFNLVSLLPQDAIYFGLVPSLLYVSGKHGEPHHKRMLAIDACEPLLTNISVIYLPVFNFFLSEYP